MGKRFNEFSPPPVEDIRRPSLFGPLLLSDARLELVRPDPTVSENDVDNYAHHLRDRYRQTYDDVTAVVGEMEDGLPPKVAFNRLMVVEIEQVDPNVSN